MSYGCDEGGNKVNTRCEYISGQGEIYDNLHKVWDSVFIESYSYDYTVWVQKLQSLIAKNSSIIPTALQGFDPEVWAQESYNYTRIYAYWFDMPYNPYPTDETHYPSGNHCPYTDTAYLGEAYYDTNFPIIQERLMYGGIRLAHLLNSIFSEKAPPAGQKCDLTNN